ncbi:GNAT family N-acetyltransferase [Sulfitobacter sabulilitoris]|uniref:GNAT family N-acetyltransferase n=1 Tax=Sulfitobacter sabulilitoris TaxID=2562655 RepID=A0A5S3Q7H4_9RHOB|nr:GNAT family N-acetyltransferase [Sulfitobacter sabulilitoris]TMM52803.1 GNAT family N-acetyltransferase [Sulfitobacter sabulilitoris]
MIADGLHDVPAGKVAMIVTHLEMRSRPRLRPGTLPEDVKLRRVTPDLEWYRDIFARVGALEWLWYGRLRLSDDALRGIITDPGVEIFTLAHDGQDEALLELDFREDGACELAYFGLTPALIGSGAGRALMNEAISRAWARDISRFHVHTCTIDSPQALPFYLRSGFSVTRQQVEIDDDPRVLGVLPETAGPHVPLLRP